jgi:hypothetical protein
MQGAIYWGYKMKTFTIYLAVFILVVAIIFGFKYVERGKKIASLTTENNALKGNISFMEKRIEKEHADTLAISQRNKELEEAVKQEKSSFDWNADISNSPVIKQLQAN